MSGPENTFIRGVNKLLPGDVYHMKNHNEYTGGIADCYYDGSVADMWVEYKFLVLPKRDDTVIDLVGGRHPMLSALQQQWLRDRYENGRLVFVIVGTATGGVLFKDRAWERPHATAYYKKWMMTRRALAEFISSTVCGHG